ncbi:MAG: hypothetical protein COB53_04325 [Elusimicrobia bacterium]|nr:MAG: hypothetical protein COB53_04325 [Elusimicrobiota bacterium]
MKLIALLLLLSPAAHADSIRMRPFEAGNRSVGLQIGVATPSQPAFKKGARNGPFIGIPVTYYLSDWIAVGAELSFLNFSGTALPGTQGASTFELSQKFRAISATIFGRVNFFERGTWTPYVLGGAGVHTTSASNTIETLSGPEVLSPVEPIQPGSGIAVTAGTGVEVFLVRDASLSFDVRFHKLYLKSPNDLESLSFMLGFHYWWGRNW